MVQATVYVKHARVVSNYALANHNQSEYRALSWEFGSAIVDGVPSIDYTKLILSMLVDEQWQQFIWIP
ncbi:hypothetical protein PM082_013497 [Marasmius tenuissimus]|nr:hypothetical protein PM082_013497 [Marasmius tenuissimus]